MGDRSRPNTQWTEFWRVTARICEHPRWHCQEADADNVQADRRTLNRTLVSEGGARLAPAPRLMEGLLLLHRRPPAPSVDVGRYTPGSGQHVGGAGGHPSGDCSPVPTNV